MRPKYYKQCSELGKEILLESGFPLPEYFDQECFEVIDLLGKDFYLGNCMKYLWRLGNKKSVFPWENSRLISKDLLKAQIYLETYINQNQHLLDQDKENYQWYFNLREVLMIY